MAVLDIMKGKITFNELTELPNRIFHHLYYKHYLIVTNKDKDGANKIKDDELIDQMEEAAEKGML